MRQSVRGVEARKTSDNEQMSGYLCSRGERCFNLQYTREKAPPVHYRTAKLKIEMKASRLKKKMVRGFLLSIVTLGCRSNDEIQAADCDRRKGFKFNT